MQFQQTISFSIIEPMINMKYIIKELIFKSRF